MAHGAAGSMSISIGTSVHSPPSPTQVTWMGPDECVHIESCLFFLTAPGLNSYTLAFSSCRD